MSNITRGTTRVPISDIPIGIVCHSDIFDEAGRLLLGKGNAVTLEFRDQLVERGTTYLDLPNEDLASSRRSEAAKMPRKARALNSTVELKHQRVDRSCEAYCETRGKKIANQIHQGVRTISRLGQSIQSLTKEEVVEIREVPTSLLSSLLEDADQAIIQSLSSEAADLLAARCIRMSMLSINTAIEMELATDEVLRIGAAALLHDFGLFLSPRKLHDPRARLNDDECWNYRQHPITARDLLHRYPAIDQETIVIAAHVHERNDGSGYPRGLKKNVIHSLARVIHVVDTYLTLTDYYGVHPVIAPHDAMMFLLHETSRGMLSQDAVRAFLNINSLYPLGSKVQLSDGREGVVVRRNRTEYTHPFVECVETGELIDTQVGVEITGASINVDWQRRLHPEMLKKASLEELLSLTM